MVALMFAVFAPSPLLAEADEDTALALPELRVGVAEAAARINFDQRICDMNDVSPIVTNYEGIVRFEFPRNTRIAYLYGAKLLFGCIRGADTLVSEGPGVGPSFIGEPAWEMNSYQDVVESSSQRNRPNYDPAARAQQQFTQVYDDTAVVKPGRNPGYYYDAIEQRPHVPIGIEVRQTTYVWSDEFSKRFIIVDYWIKNISGQPIEDACVGVYVDPDIYWVPRSDRNPLAVSPTINFNRWPPPFKSPDDICGLLQIVPGIIGGTKDTVNIAWAIDNDGDPWYGDFNQRSPTSAIGVRVLRAPGGPFSFNWWVTDEIRSDWGPRLMKNQSNYYRFPGSPFGDRNRYRMMTNREIDYDQVYSAIDHAAEGWGPLAVRPGMSRDVADGGDCRMILSHGPFGPIAPGDSVPFTVAFFAGAHVHTDPANFTNNFSPFNPHSYLDHLNFTDLIRNGRWADWVFDNPGTDSDTTDAINSRGRAYLIDCAGVDTVGYDTTIVGNPPETTLVPIEQMKGCDSVFYKGDGIPDFSGPSAPPGPVFQLITKPNRAILRWDGAYSETVRDPISGVRDFEGYRVYAARTDINDQYSLITSWDKEDYRRLAYDPATQSWLPVSDPLPLERWRQIFDDTSFYPGHYATPSFAEAYLDTFPDTLRNADGAIVEIVHRARYSYWIAEADNRGNEYDEGGGRDTNLIQRIGQRDTVVAGERMAYGIYEMTLDRLQSSVPLYFAVTTFDFGNYRTNLGPLESAPGINSRYAQPIYSADIVLDSGLKVGVFPNPYKIEYRDGRGNRTSYFREGYEGTGELEFSEYDRRINFINLPDTATIRIYSLDGDLIREIHHPDPFLTTYSSSVGWDLISRNAQAVVSGIYIYRIDSRLGSQVGKIVIIK